MKHKNAPNGLKMTLDGVGRHPGGVADDPDAGGNRLQEIVQRARERLQSAPGDVGPPDMYIRPGSTTVGRSTPPVRELACGPRSYDVFDLLPAEPGTANRPAPDRGERRREECAVHGAYIARRTGLLGGLWSSCPLCVADAAERRLHADIERARALRREQSEQRSRDLLAQSGVPRRYLGARLGDFERLAISAEGAQAAAEAAVLCRETVEKVANRATRAENVAILGGYHVGKTHLACASARHAVELGLSARYDTCHRYVSSVKDGWGRERRFDVSAHVGADVLILDEVGAGACSESDMMLLYDLVDRRYQDCRPTVFVSNLDPLSFREFWGERLIQKLADDGLLVISATWEPPSFARRSSDAAAGVDDSLAARPDTDCDGVGARRTGGQS